MLRMPGAKLATCKCGVSTGGTGHAVVFDPVLEHWTYIVWDPTRQGEIPVIGTRNVGGCPVCLSAPLGVLPEDVVPQVCHDHLCKIHPPAKIPALKVSDIPIREGAMPPQTILTLPQPDEV